MAKVPVDLTAIIKELLLRIIDVQEQATALRFAMEDAGVLTPELKASSRARAAERWKSLRQAIERAGTTDEALLLELLQNFEGPVQ